MFYLVQFIGAFILHGLLFVFPSLLLPHKLNAWKIAALSFVLTALTVFRSLFAQDSGIFLIITFSTMILCFVLVLLLLYKGQVWKRFAVFISFFILTLFGETVAISITETIYGIDAIHHNETMPLLTIYALSGAFIILFGSAYVLVWKMVAARKFQPYYLMLFIFPIGQAITVYGFMFEILHFLWIVGFIIGMAANIVLLIYIMSLEKKTALEEELRETRHAMELEQSHYRAVEKRREALIKIRHDFNNHLAAIGHLITAGENPSAQDMITALSKDILETKENPYCNIPVVNAILTEKAETCAAEGIALAVELSLPPQLAIEQLHLCSIFGNLLDNAINACKKIQTAPSIQLTSGADGDYLFIKSVNPSEKPPKTTAPGHGHGLRIVSDLAALYDGDYCAEYNDGVYTVVVSLLAVKEV